MPAKLLPVIFITLFLFGNAAYGQAVITNSADAMNLKVTEAFNKFQASMKRILDIAQNAQASGFTAQDAAEMESANRDLATSGGFVLGVSGFISKVCKFDDVWQKSYEGFFGSIQKNHVNESYEKFKEGWQTAGQINETQPITQHDCDVAKSQMAGLSGQPPAEPPPVLAIPVPPGTP